MEEKKAIIRWNKDELVSNDPQERVLVFSKKGYIPYYG